jgi:hypothetical protein
MFQPDVLLLTCPLEFRASSVTTKKNKERADFMASPEVADVWAVTSLPDSRKRQQFRRLLIVCAVPKSQL